MKLVRLLGAGALLAATPAFASVLSGPLVNPANGHTYYLLDQATWTAAEAEAVSLGGHLATVNDLAENTFIYGAFANYGGVQRNLWIGLYDPTPANNWSSQAARRAEFGWVSGDPSAYRKWNSTEPNPSWPNEYYVHLWHPGDSGASNWNDYCDCTILNTRPMNGVVEISPIPEPQAYALLLAGMGLLGFAARRRRAGA